ncbi:MAG TPA: MFS transporter [Anaerolineales bacterium]|nr:MFS transporter [Anaerolineales bacterium]
MGTIQTKPSASPYIATIAYYLSFIVLGLTTAASGPSLLKLAEHTSSELDRISLIFVFGSLGYIAGSYLGGRAYDRVPAHKLIVLTLVILAVASALIPISRSLEILLFSMVLSGLASGILDVGCNTLILWTHKEKAGPFLNGLHFFFGVGSLIAPFLVGQILPKTGDILWVYLIFSIICLPTAVWVWFLPDPPRQVHTEDAKSASFPLVPVLLIVILFLLYVGLELGFGNWIYTYTVTLGLGTITAAANLNGVFWGSFTLGRLLGVWVSTRLRPQTILFLDILGCAVSIAVIMLWKESSLALWIGTVGLGASMASIFPTFIILAGERMKITGTITGWFLVGSGAGSMLLPWLIGQIFVRTGPKAMTTVLLINLVGILLFLLLFLTRQAEPLPEPVSTD